ncbi:unnamed protein product [Brachionus calyciflorus]|uniref:Uncharacterized protein n=1 Tax=Brachionus calyciflorus TaxID=104777 RepID=A0A813Z9X9_9BILA|nr:unnamed protein product [Brachionus calyciflorus]
MKFYYLNFLLSLNLVLCNRIWIEPRYYYFFGKSSPPEECPPNYYVIGFNLKLDKYKWFKDNTGLNGIKLICNDWHRTELTSGEYELGKWTPTYGPYFNGFIGAELYSFPISLFIWDDTTLNDIHFIEPDNKVVKVNNVWRSKRAKSFNLMCPKETKICGIKTQVENKRYFFDDTGLNSVAFLCCKI